MVKTILFMLTFDLNFLIYLKPAVTTEELDTSDSERIIFNKNNGIMLWICKTDDKAYYYTVSIEIDLLRMLNIYLSNKSILWVQTG